MSLGDRGPATECAPALHAAGVVIAAQTSYCPVRRANMGGHRLKTARAPFHGRRSVLGHLVAGRSAHETTSTLLAGGSDALNLLGHCVDR
jgi:hypothetical protein